VAQAVVDYSQISLVLQFFMPLVAVGVLIAVQAKVVIVLAAMVDYHSVHCQQQA
jgi:hypothetical protein